MQLLPLERHQRLLTGCVLCAVQLQGPYSNETFTFSLNDVIKRPNRGVPEGVEEDEAARGGGADGRDAERHAPPGPALSQVIQDLG